MGLNKPMANIPLSILIDECGKGDKTKEEIFSDFSLANRENIHQVFKYKKFNYDFTDYLSTYIDNDGIMTYFRPSYDEFIYNLIRLLNLEDVADIKDSNELSRKLNERINLLSSIRTEHELFENFPLLFNDLVEGRKFIEKIDADLENEDRHYYYSCAMKKSLENFIVTQTELYRRFVNQREEYKKRIERCSYNKYMKDNFDLDKVAMLVVDQYLRICEETDDIMVINKYLPSIRNYEASSYDKRVRVKNINGKEINDYDIEYRTIILIDRVNNLKKGTINWEIAPSSKNVKLGKTKGSRITLFNYEEINRLKALGKTKNNYYENTKYAIKIVGINGISGYTAYVYENGEVILDREYDEKNPRSATGMAVNNLKIGDFEVLSKLDRSELKRHPNVKWIPHTKYWKDKVDKIINREATEEEKEEVKQFIKKNKRID